MTILARCINYLAGKPVILDTLRRALEANHRGEKRVIRTELPERFSARILDLGCGTGVFSPLFGPGYVGVDLSPTYISYARKKYPKQFLVADAKELPFANGSFDAVWVNGVLHHFDDGLVRATVSEMRRVLKDSGRAVVMEDVPAHTLVSRLVRSMDLGDHIRTPTAYATLLSERFAISTHYPIRTGVCDYEVFVLQK